MHIYTTADLGFLEQLHAMILSLQANNSNTTLHILHDSFSSKLIRSITRKYRKPNNLIVFNKIDSSIFSGLEPNANGGYEHYFRLLYPHLFKDSNRLLYLDCDIVVRASLSDLFKIDLKNNVIAAVSDYGFSRHSELGLDIHEQYFNSGMMLIDVKSWNENNVCENVVLTKKERPLLKYFDQDPLNIVLKGKWLEINSEWNYTTMIALHDEFVNNNSNRENVKIVHYTGGDCRPWRPWNRGSIHPYRQLYYQYQRKTVKNITHRLPQIRIKKIITKSLKHLLVLFLIYVQKIETINRQIRNFVDLYFELQENRLVKTRHFTNIAQSNIVMYGPLAGAHLVNTNRVKYILPKIYGIFEIELFSEIAKFENIIFDSAFYLGNRDGYLLFGASLLQNIREMGLFLENEIDRYVYKELTIRNGSEWNNLIYENCDINMISSLSGDNAVSLIILENNCLSDYEKYLDIVSLVDQQSSRLVLFVKAFGDQFDEIQAMIRKRLPNIRFNKIVNYLNKYERINLLLANCNKGEEPNIKHTIHENYSCENGWLYYH